MTSAQFASNVRPMRVRGTARVRPFVAADIAQVAEVHRAAFRRGNDTRAAEYTEYFTRVFLDTADRGIASLVFQDHDGGIVGFVGIVPRRIAIAGRHYLAAISSQFIVDPSTHVALVALRLAKAYLDGPQDLSIADEANDVSRRIWEGLGGTTALLLSMYWTRALRPAQLGLSFLRARRAVAPLAVAGAPLALIADGVAARFPGSHFRQPRPATMAAPLFAQTVVEHAPGLCDPAALRVDYDEQTFQRLLDRTAVPAAGRRGLNTVVKSGTSVLGWYVADIDADGLVEVAHVAATAATISEVLDHLFYHAWSEGGVSVTGRLEPRFMQALSDKYCVFHRRGPWVLIKSNTPELVRALESGRTCLSRLDGEWSLRFRPQHP